jgi:hypothetical protein
MLTTHTVAAGRKYCTPPNNLTFRLYTGKIWARAEAEFMNVQFL